MNLRKLKRLLLSDSHHRGAESTEPGGVVEAHQTVEKSKVAQREVLDRSSEMDQAVERARRIRARNGFGQLADMLFEQETERRRNLHHGNGSAT